MIAVPIRHFKTERVRPCSPNVHLFTLKYRKRCRVLHEIRMLISYILIYCPSSPVSVHICYVFSSQLRRTCIVELLTLWLDSFILRLMYFVAFLHAIYCKPGVYVLFLHHASGFGAYSQPQGSGNKDHWKEEFPSHRAVP